MQYLPPGISQPSTQAHSQSSTFPRSDPRNINLGIDHEFLFSDPWVKMTMAYVALIDALLEEGDDVILPLIRPYTERYISLVCSSLKSTKLRDTPYTLQDLIHKYTHYFLSDYANTFIELAHRIGEMELEESLGEMSVDEYHPNSYDYRR